MIQIFLGTDFQISGYREYSHDASVERLSPGCKTKKRPAEAGRMSVAME